MTELLREYWDWFLFDTLVWTGALIALVMLLRRPVARYFGSGAAYALWFVPLARLVLPPFTLPAWMGPTRESVPVSFETAPMVLPERAGSASTYFADMAATPPAPSTFPDPTDLVMPLVAIWLLGAGMMLVRRFWLYFELRRDLLEYARPVGEAGNIRLIETPAISGPMAFGVIDRVIALPEGFMASRDRMSRDLAIAHELAHHRGGDLIVNMAVQPLFAIHWFNPLGWLGWNALRRDQEAACDARVVAARPREERATYAGIIADFARHPQGTPRPALAAPMACPVLGDKSIIHRLRSLNMSDISPRRRLAGRATLASAFLAVPLTASVCFAEAAAAPTPPAAPEAPLTWVMPVPAAPLAPPAPDAPPAPEVDEDVDVDIDIQQDGEVRVERRVIVDKDGERRVVRRFRRDMSEEERAELEADLAEMEADLAEMRADTAMSHANMRREITLAVAEAHAEASEARAEAMAAAGEAIAMSDIARASAPRVVMKCKDKTNIVATEVDGKGRTTMFVCEANADKIALTAVKSARKAIAADRNLSDSERAEALRAIDKEIAELKRK
ncbi:M56 family metallopeptidase [Qipengyuania gaetbuli]|uniref:M56 family metallopeptidase n=1 Tax=Qipengyuania gaetbuli TaxID=266952 RepID=UPI001CD2ADD0|nr:M56 family metallopeptidase [Qipengyuania gaetbuli]MCA0911241.1 M56 family metallopeptidase [Qipengyuania gaetbuli]